MLELFKVSVTFSLLIIFFPLVILQTQLEYPPTVFLTQPQAGDASLIGNPRVLLCSANGNPTPVYRWKKDGAFLTPYNVTENVKNIKNMQRSDAGVYQCMASNGFGSILSDKVRVDVLYMVPFANGVARAQPVEQGRARIIDLPPIDCFPEPRIQWYEDGNYPITDESPRYHVSLTNQLIILDTKLTTDNNKLFKATATNIFTQQSSDSQTFYLTVQNNAGSTTSDIPPEIILSPVPTTAIQGIDQSVKLECVANARPLNFLSLSWYRKSSTERLLINPDNIKYLLSRYRRVLTIRNPVITDSGVYECIATFTRPGVESQTTSAQAALSVYVKPNLEVPPPSELTKDVGSSVLVNCQSIGIPEPVVQWYRNSEMITSTTTSRYQIFQNGTLRITAAASEDSGMFQCFVSNSAGEVSAATWIRVLSKYINT